MAARTGIAVIRPSEGTNLPSFRPGSGGGERVLVGRGHHRRVTTTSTELPVPPTPARRITRLWPVALALVFAALMWGAPPESLAEVLMLLPLVYLVTAATRTRGASWPALLACLGVLVALRAQDRVDVATGVAAVAAVVLVGGLLRSAGRAGMLVQAAGMLAFAGTAVLALEAGGDLARALVATGWLLHGAWDAVHLVRRTVVSRSYALWCAVLDVLVGLQLLLAL